MPNDASHHPEPGLYVIGHPVRIVAMFHTPDGKLAHVCYPMSHEQAENFGNGLLQAASAEAARVAADDAEFLSSLRISQ